MLSKVLVLFMVGSPLATGSLLNPLSSAQTPSIKSCLSTGIVKLNKVTIEDAQLGKTMLVQFAFSISQPLKSNPKARVTVRNEDGSKIPCLSNLGSCTYRICGGITTVDRELGKPWNNKCPVPAISTEESIAVKLGPAAELLIPFAPTVLNVHVEVTDGRTVVGCDTLDVKIEEA